MGEISDDIISGDCCALCGQYFETSQGVAVACSDCWEFDCGYPKSDSETL